VMDTTPETSRSIKGGDALAAQPPEFPPDVGIVIVGHGTANPTGAAETAAVAEQVARLIPGLPVELGYLEVIEPSIDVAVGRLAGRGCREILALPLLLFAAGHAKRDVPAALAEAVSKRGLAVRQAAALGLHPEIVRLVRSRYLETVADLPPLPTGEALLVVGRGSSDPTAATQFWGLVRRCFAPVPRIARQPVRIGFVAAARPTLDEAIEALGQPGFGRPAIGRVVVQPHLLFTGHVENQVSARLARARSEHPRIEWLQVPRLGPAAEVVRAVIDRGLDAAWNGHAASTAGKFKAG
jgi:sirohydrochlorin cobaltochelatase